MGLHERSQILFGEGSRRRRRRRGSQVFWRQKYVKFFNFWLSFKKKRTKKRVKEAADKKFPHLNRYKNPVHKTCIKIITTDH
jgi:hypothetical protein